MPTVEVELTKTQASDIMARYGWKSDLATAVKQLIADAMNAKVKASARSAPQEPTLPRQSAAVDLSPSGNGAPF